MTLRTGALALLLFVAGCGGQGTDPGSEPPAGASPKIEDPGPVHVHGLGVNPTDGSLFVATHTGLFRAAKGQRTAERVADRYQDTMGFTIAGPDDFLGSGHPDGREKLPPFLGLIRSRDGGATWQAVSLQGRRDFHVLEAAGRRVYGFGSDYDTRRASFLVSEDGGRSWQERKVPEALISLAIDHGEPRRLVASGQRGLHSSDDGGRRWRALEGPAGLVAWTDRLVIVDGDGTVHSAAGPDARVRPTGEIGGQPAALDAGLREDLYVALHDGTIKRSTDGGQSWSVRATP